MLPTAGKRPAEEQKPHHSPTKLKIKSSFHSLKTLVSSRHCAYITATIFLQLLIILVLNKSSPSPPPPSTERLDFEAPPPDDACKYGKIYIYNLPSILNKDFLQNCDKLDPWNSRCAAVSNGGFGPPASGLSDVVPRNLTPAWYWTDMYAAEVIYHVRLMNHKCRTLNRDEASAFYIPFYAGLAVGRYLWYNYTSKDRDSHSVTMLNWVKNQDPWKKSNGSDHFIVLGRLTWDFRRLTDNDRDWGTKLIYMPLMKNVLRLSVEKLKWDPLEISVPYPTSFHPRSGSDIRLWQNFVKSRKRSSLFSFVGATRKKIKNDFRAVLMNYCKSEVGSCRIVDCSIADCDDGASAIMEAFLGSIFCLQPKGDGSTRRSTFDCMLAGAIPVFFWKGSFEYQYEWHLPSEARSYSVFIDNNDVRNMSWIIRDVLEKYSRKQVEKMRDVIVDFIPRFLYSGPNVDLGGSNDAFDIAIDGVLRMFKHEITAVVPEFDAGGEVTNLWADRS